MTEPVNHIKPLRLFDIARDSGLPVSAAERTHLLDCEECQRIVQVFARQFDKSHKPAQAKHGDAA